MLIISVHNSRIVSHTEVQNAFTFCITLSNYLMSNNLFVHRPYAVLVVPTWPFRSPITTTSLLLLVLSISVCTFPKNSSFSSPGLHCCGAYSIMKMAFSLSKLPVMCAILLV